VEAYYHDYPEDQQDDGEYAHVTHRQAFADMVEHQRGPG
jgi:hypothetical protein